MVKEKRMSNMMDEAVDETEEKAETEAQKELREKHEQTVAEMTREVEASTCAACGGKRKYIVNAKFEGKIVKPTSASYVMNYEPPELKDAKHAMCDYALDTRSHLEALDRKTKKFEDEFSQRLGYLEREYVASRQKLPSVRLRVAKGLAQLATIVAGRR